MCIKPFDKNELKVLGKYPTVEADPLTIPGVLTSKLNTPITPRENWDLFFQRKNPAWVPDGIYDVNLMTPYIIPDAIACSHAGGYDSFGVKWIPDESCPELPAFVEPGFRLINDIADWKQIKIPDVSKWAWDEAADKYAMLDTDRYNATFMQSSLFERMISVLGFEEAAVSFLTDPDSTHAFLDAIIEYDLALIEHVKKYMKNDLIVFSDDWGAQRSPFFSEKVVEEFLAPRVTKLVKRTHDLGMYFMHHCCGRVTSFLPYMIDEGVDSWQFNFEAVEDTLPEAMGKYGDKILFDGLFAYLRQLPAEEQVFKNGVDEFFKKYGKTGVCTVSVMDWNEWSFDSRAYSYEVSRKTL